MSHRIFPRPEPMHPPCHFLKSPLPVLNLQSFHPGTIQTSNPYLVYPNHNSLSSNTLCYLNQKDRLEMDSRGKISPQ